MANLITISQFKEALGRYPSVLAAKAQATKEGAPTIQELDKFRYVEAPARFSKKTGRTMSVEDLNKLVQWKLRHGTYRPSLSKLVASNTDEKIEDATQDAFSHYAKVPTDIKGVIEKISALKGIGPATASLILSVHDPENIVFFSDEVYAWLVNSGNKKSLKYTIKEFEEVYAKAEALTRRLGVNPIDCEKVAFVVIRENEPVRVPAPKYEPSGLPRGRPKLAEKDKKQKKEPSGLPRGRPRNPDSKPKATKAKTPATPKSATATGKGRGRPKKEVTEDDTPALEAKSPKAKTPATPKSAASTGKGRGRPKKEVTENDTPTPKSSAKRKATDEPTLRGRPKKVKA